MISQRVRLLKMVRPAKRGRGRGRGRPPMYDPDDPPEFFKIYLPELNSKQLLIPPDFVKDFLGRIPKKLTLKNKTFEGKVWNVELEKVEDKLLMKKGWESFVIDNSLERGEFMTFAYCGNAVFTVTIFSISGCKKNKTTATNDKPCVKLKLEPDMDEVFSHHTHDGEETNIERQVILAEPLYQDSQVVTKVVPDKTIEQKRVCFTKAIFKPLYELRIPAAIFTDYNIKPPKATTPKMILLRNRSGDSHKVKLLQRTDRAVLSSGWKEFKLKNNIVKGDECEFEVILGKGRNIKEILLLRISRRKAARTQQAGLQEFCQEIGNEIVLSGLT